MITLRKSNQRGHANHGWLDSYHTFSFGDYHDLQEMSFGSLRVINEDKVEPGGGFPTHGHRDMEIVTYVLAGALEHKDSMGNGSVMRPGEVQRMSAGTGVQHSEFNASQTEQVHFLQIWLLPKLTGIPPGYEQKHFDEASKNGRLCLIASGDGREGSVTVHQDAAIYATLLTHAEVVTHVLAPGRRAYLHVARGNLELNGLPMTAGDGAKIEDEQILRLHSTTRAEALLFDL